MSQVYPEMKAVPVTVRSCEQQSPDDTQPPTQHSPTFHVPANTLMGTSSPALTRTSETATGTDAMHTALCTDSQTQALGAEHTCVRIEMSKGRKSMIGSAHGQRKNNTIRTRTGQREGGLGTNAGAPISASVVRSARLHALVSGVSGAATAPSLQ